MNEFRTEFGRNIFKSKYALNQGESWKERCRHIVRDVCGRGQDDSLRPLMSKEEREQLVKYMEDFKFVAGGRYIYYAGRESRFYNNCFGGNQEFITNCGLMTFKEAYIDAVNSNDNTVYVLSPITNRFERAYIHQHGSQELYDITFKNVKGRSNKTWTVRTTKDHRWVLEDGTETTNLSIGDVVPATGYDATYNQAGWIHGAVFADGNVHEHEEHFGHQLRLCGEKARWLHSFTHDKVSVSYPEFSNGDPLLYIKSNYNLKELPNTTNPNYISSFIQGWLDFDGTKKGVKQLHTINKIALEYFSDNAYLANCVVSGDMLVETKDSNFGPRKPLYRCNIQHSGDFQGFKVVDIAYVGVDDVYCVEEPEHHMFTLKDGMVTGNCYLLRSEEDSREDWAETARKATSCLMTGGGIGNDYSILRPSGSLIRKTGGYASGPIPLAHMVNEIGRNVRQGGSRRSAIYASLNWQHEDADDFLKAKNWSETLRKLKAEDFNFPAPLDMTNISLNYDDDFLRQVRLANLNLDFSLPETFLKNVKQALMTGEPGFSFNFGDKQNETLRNACTEVTSEDDSDVCNLGSINIGNIESLDEFRSVVGLASKFLVCGTIRADLPYEKVRKVREKNRRLGLGLMGIHEWLLRKGYRYEVTPELHEWLKVYERESKISADIHCDRLYISRPVAYRAIAPTGTIGILAGTTTGIEPLYSVAYKRRYLTEGTKWKYEYVIDSTAEYLISKYEINPDDIQTAASMSKEIEKRIAFQADIQDYVDMAISSTINLPAWNTEFNNNDLVSGTARTIAKYSHRLRGLTFYPDSSRGGQPLTTVPYEEAKSNQGKVFAEEFACKSGVCGV